MTYDAHGRPIQIGFGATTAAPTTYASTITLTWDKGDRLTQINDSAYGTITREYDGLDRLIKETSPQGQVSYTYDAACRRKTMTVLGQLKLTYTYDNANRRTQVTLANGTKINTSYDNADQITAISYTKADCTSLGNLTYNYDGKGRRIGVGGSLSNTELPAAITDPLYDANNRLTRCNGKTFQYDANGNLTNDGERSYSWNARDELQGLGGTQTASFRYDPMGRRSAKTINTTTTGYLYDGLDFVQELAGTTSTSGVRANLITGGLDEPLLRITGTGSTATLSHFFSDANNNVIALTDSTQAIATKYSYGAYGQSKQTTVSGATNTNSQQYTGRENDGTGLMYYRARYYHVGCARFISEDPIGWASGQTNNYAYVGGDPVNWSDPYGLMKAPCDPSGLPSEWQKDPRHHDPSGERYRHPSGDYVDFHRGRPGLPGWRGKDHWHHNGGDDHIAPGEEIPDPPTSTRNLTPYIVGGVIIVGGVVITVVAPEVFVIGAALGGAGVAVANQGGCR